MPSADLVIEGDRALVTAAGRGIGREIARQLAESGVDVALNDVDADAATAAADAVTTADGRVVALPADVSDRVAASELVDTTVEALGGLDILVNCVGVAGPRAPAEEISPEAFMETLAVNLGGVFNPTRFAIEHLLESDAGRIVSLSSKSAKLPRTHRLPYATAKMGLVGFTRALALELAPRGVTVNAVVPGTVAGDRLDRVMAMRAANLGIPVDEVRRRFRESSPLGVFTRPEDVAGAVLYLCSSRADRVVGQALNVTAGRLMH